MDADNSPPDASFIMGTYSVIDGRRLLEALEESSVEFEVEFHDGAGDITPFQSYTGGRFGQAAQITIHVAPTDKEKAERIHADLFGDCLPNYDSSFFSQSNPTDAPEEPV